MRLGWSTRIGSALFESEKRVKERTPRSFTLDVIYTPTLTRMLNLAAGCSALIFGVIVLAWLIGDAIDPSQHFISLSSHCHLSLRAHGPDVRLVIFNDAHFGPNVGNTTFSIAG